MKVIVFLLLPLLISSKNFLIESKDSVDTNSFIHSYASAILIKLQQYRSGGPDQLRQQAEGP